MGSWHAHTERWLSSEHLAQETTADEAFAQVFAALPAVEPSDDFVRRAVQAAWQAEARRRRATAWATIAACLVAATVTGVGAYGVLVWASFAEGLVRASASITEHAGLVRRLAFPVEVLPLEAVLIEGFALLASFHVFPDCFFHQPMRCTVLRRG